MFEVALKNSYFTNPGDFDGVRLVSSLLIGNHGINYRPSRVVVYNVTYEHIMMNRHPPLWVGSITPGEIYLDTITFRNVTASTPILALELFSDFVLQNILFEDITNSGDYFILGANCISVSLKNITMRNVEAAETQNSNLIHFGSTTSNITIDNLVVENSKLGPNSLMKLYSLIPGGFILHNVVVRNVQLTGSQPLFGGNLITGFDIYNITFENISKDTTSSYQESNFLVNFNSYAIPKDGSCILDQVVVKNSTVPFFLFNSLQDTSADGSQLRLSNFEYRDCNLEFKDDLIYFKSVFSTSTFTMTILNAKFYNLHFVRGGNVINFAHQISSQLLMKNTEFTNITAGQIRIESFVKKSNETTNVLFQNVTAHDINANYVSFVALGQGGRLQIRDSQFYGIYSTFRGPVLSSSFQGTRVEAVNTQFYNNSAFQGGVASIEQESYFQCTNCSFHSNFGAEAGVIFQASNGYIKLNECNILNNYALSKPFLEILESVNLSILNK